MRPIFQGGADTPEDSMTLWTFTGGDNFHKTGVREPKRVDRVKLGEELVDGGLGDATKFLKTFSNLIGK